MKLTSERIIAVDIEHSLNNPEYREQFGRYYFALDYVKDKKVLDVACGISYGSAILAKKASQVFCLDNDKNSIDYAKTHYPYSNLKFSLGDAQDLNFPDNFFDVVVSFETIEHLSAPLKFLKEIKRVLRPNGILILSSMDMEIIREITLYPFRENPFHIKEYNLRELTLFLNQFFEIESIYGQFLYKSSFFRITIRNILRRLLKFDQKELLKKFLPSSLLIRIPRAIAGIKRDPRPISLKGNMRAQINIIVSKIQNKKVKFITPVPKVKIV